MGSTMAKNVAREYLGMIGKGKKASVLQIGQKHGYSLKTANSGHIQKTVSFQAIINPAIKKLEQARDNAMREILSRKLDDVDYSDLTNSVTRFNHDIQLLSGNSTENVAVVNVTEQYNELINKVKADS